MQQLWGQGHFCGERQVIHWLFHPGGCLQVGHFNDDCVDGDGDSDALQMTMTVMMASTSSGDPRYTTVIKVLMITTNKGGVVLLLRSYDNCSTL